MTWADQGDPNPVHPRHRLPSPRGLMQVIPWRWGPQTPRPPKASQEEPFYEALAMDQGRPHGMWMIRYDEGWRTGILCTGIYEEDAKWLVSLIQGKPRTHAGPA